MTSEELRDTASRVLWLAGGPDAGKSTIARVLARRHGLRLYSLDKHGQAHLEQLAAGSNTGAAAYREVLDTSPVERLAQLAPAEHLEWLLTFARQRFPLLLKDLQGFEGRGPILVEGAGLLPELVKPLLSSARQAMWLIPTEPFIVANWDRSKKRFSARQAADPAQARHALMTVDRLIAERLSVEAQSHEMPLLMVDGSQTPHEVATQVGEHFQPVLPAAT